MNKDDIITLPHPSLRTKSKKTNPTSESTRKLADNMMEATLDWEDSRKHEFGVALAAVQIDRLERVIVIRNNFEDKEDRSFVVLINPQIIRLEGKIVEDSEGCLSVKNVYGKVPRHEKIKIKALDLEGNEFRLKADGFLARVLQHEIDHIEGKLFVDMIEGEDKFYTIADNGKLNKIPFAEIEDSSDLWE